MTAPVVPLLRSDPRHAHIIAAPSTRRNGDPINLCIDPNGSIRRMLASGLVDKLAEYEGLVHGGIPGGTRGMIASIALFYGIRRPMIAANNDNSIMVYVTNHRHTYRYADPKRAGIDLPAREDAPADSVFVVYAELTDAASAKALEIADRLGARHLVPVGLVYNWEWVLASPSEPTLPDNFSTRYAGRTW